MRVPLRRETQQSARLAEGRQGQSAGADREGSPATDQERNRVTKGLEALYGQLQRRWLQDCHFHVLRRLRRAHQLVRHRLPLVHHQSAAVEGQRGARPVILGRREDPGPSDRLCERFSHLRGQK